MSQIYTFNESGSIPGIPGTFAHCRVEIFEDGELQITPLEQYPAFTEPVVSIDAQLPIEEPPQEALQDEPVAQPISVPLVQNGG